jgi:hypothetical protein
MERQTQPPFAVLGEAGSDSDGEVDAAPSWCAWWGRQEVFVLLQEWW